MIYILGKRILSEAGFIEASRSSSFLFFLCRFLAPGNNVEASLELVIGKLQNHTVGDDYYDVANN